jgi:UDP-glucose 4-epimerase
VLDNLCNSKREVVQSLEAISKFRPEFVVGDIRDRQLVKTVFDAHAIDAVIHFAGLKAVGESVANPLAYYDNNVTGSIVLLEEMQRAGVNTLVFSSSATVYGAAASTPINESADCAPTNPYGRTKWFVEKVLADLGRSNPDFKSVILRYFNPVGAHTSGLIGENPNGTPNNLMPYILDIARGVHAQLNVFGDDYPTPDGTGVRDYIHVEDLAAGHLKALEWLDGHNGSLTLNLGTGRGYSVLEMVKAFEAVSGVVIPYQVVDRRLGDVAVSCADPSRAALEIGWCAQRGLEEMCRDAWRFAKQKGTA